MLPDLDDVCSKDEHGTPLCPYCGHTARRSTGREIYPYRRDLYRLLFWVCFDCDARAQIDPVSGHLLGTMADRELRQWRMKTHAVFDPLWHHEAMTRSEAYDWAAKQLIMRPTDCHIGKFDIGLCKRLIRAVMMYNNQFS